MSTAGTTSTELPPLTNTFGAVLLSSFFALALWGVTVHQTLRYYRLYPKDAVFLKMLVVLLLAADTFHSVTLIHISYHYLINNYYNPLALLEPVWSIALMPLSTGLLPLIAQSFYTRRIYLINPRYIVAVGFITLLILTEVGFVISSTYHAVSSATFTDFTPNLWENSVLFAIATGTDLILMIVFVFILRQSRTPFRGTRKRLDTLVLYAVIGTLLNTILTVPAFITSLTSQDTFIYMAMSIPTTKVYSNSVLAFLNCRASITESGGTKGSSSLGLSVIKGRNASRGTAPPAAVHHFSSSEGPSILDIKMAEDTHSSVGIEGPSGYDDVLMKRRGDMV